MKKTRMTRGKAVAALVLASGLLFAACGGGSEETGSGSDTTASDSGGGSGASADGKKVYDSTCTSCHGPDAKGLPNLGKDLTTSAFTADMTDEEVVAFIKAGRGADDPANTTGVAMPPKGGNPALTDEDLAAVVAYVRTLEE
jgi:disulfide bond formation protein DsbB